MSTQPPSPPKTPPPSDPTGKKDAPAPITQGKMDFRKRLPVWIQEMPQFGKFKPAEPDPNYQLLIKKDLESVMQDVPEATRKEIFDDLDFMDYELLRLFRQRDYQAKFNQNRYRKQQIYFLTLAVAATLVGSLQVISLNTNPERMPVFAFLETLVALLTAFLAAVGGRDSPQEGWLTNRRRAEQMRREYFRYMTRMPPYDEVAGYQRRMLLSQRAADINRGMYPQEQPGQTGGEDGSV
jgi:Protein of unknown function (DUF4231)